MSEFCISSNLPQTITSVTMEESSISLDVPSDSEVHEMECDNEDWIDFLKKMTLPLDEVVKATEDEEQDPEYNLMADEEIDEVDEEEFRVDRAVKVSKRELINLYTELFHEVNVQEIGPQMMNSGEESKIESKQIALLQQQMTQHVQMLTQNFILTYNHPELHQSSLLLKQYLLDVKFHCEGKEISIFHTVNLLASLEIVNYWEQLLASNSEDVKKMKMQIEQTIDKSIQCHQAGNSYVAEFPALVLETMSNSTAFVYPSLLPKIPFKSPKITVKPGAYLSESEDHLISLGLEQFLPLVTEGEKTWSRKNGIAVCKYIQEHILPHREPTKIFKHINSVRHNRLSNNPIKHFFCYGKAPPSVHLVTPLGPLLPPCRRAPEKLPYQWKKFIYPQLNESVKNPVSLMPIKTEHYPLQVSQQEKHPLKLPKESTVDNNVKKKSPRLAKRNYSRDKFKRKVVKDPLTKFVAILSRPSPSKELMQLYSPISSLDCSPNMNNCGTVENEILPSEEHCTSDETIFPGMNVGKKSFQQGDIEDPVKICEKSDQSTANKKSATNKDYPNDSNAMMVASSSAKNTNEKEPTTEDTATENQKIEKFASAFYDKMRETLTSAVYQKIMRILNYHRRGDAMGLYKKIAVVLRPKYAELADEFLLFLREKEAPAVDRLVRQIRMDNRTRFLKKIGIYFKDQPSQLKKVYTCLTELSQIQNHSSELIKNRLLPMFEQNSLLRDLFLQNFFDNPTLSSLLEGSHKSQSETDYDLDGKRELKRKPPKCPDQPLVAAKPVPRTFSPMNSSQDENTAMASGRRQKRRADESLEWEEHTAQSDSGDSCNSSVSSVTNQEQSCQLSQETSSSWRREEDKVILEVSQKESDKNVAFRIIADELTNRSIDEIESRFNMLMKLLMETYKPK